MHLSGKLNQQLGAKKVSLDLETGCTTDQQSKASIRPRVFNPHIDKSYRTSALDSCLAVSLVTGICFTLIMLVTFMALHYRHQQYLDGFHHRALGESAGFGELHEFGPRKLDGNYYRDTTGQLLENDMLKLDDEDFNGSDSVDEEGERDDDGDGDDSDTLDEALVSAITFSA